MLEGIIRALRGLWYRLWDTVFPPRRVPNPLKDHVYVFQFHGNQKLCSFSPPCVKLAHWLRIADVPHTLLSPFPTPMGPTGKVPFVEFNGKVIGDSSHIIDRLESALGKDLDKWLTPAKKAVALTVQRMVEEHIYFILAYYRQQHDEHFPRTERIYTEGLPRWFSFALRFIVRPQIISQVKGQVSDTQNFKNSFLIY